jgi:hypothetical protein
MNTDAIVTIINKNGPDHVRIRYYPKCEMHTHIKDVLFLIPKCFSASGASANTNANTSANTSANQLAKFLKNKPYTSVMRGFYTEYGNKDTYVRVSSHHNHHTPLPIFIKNQNNNKQIPETAEANHVPETSRRFFRRKTYMFIRKDFPGTFVLELYWFLEEEDFPYVSSYQHNLTCLSTTYTIEEKYGSLHITFSDPQNIDDNKSLNDIGDNNIDDNNQDANNQDVMSSDNQSNTSSVDINKDIAVITINDGDISSSLTDFFEDVMALSTRIGIISVPSLDKTRKTKN